jgi:hypothetical protein
MKYGTITPIDADTYLLDAGKAYANLSAKVTWTRRVHYDRGTDILEIKDHVVTADGRTHELAFNWVAEGTVADINKVSLPAGYVMLARPDRNLNLQVLRLVIDTDADAFNTVLATASQTATLDVTWYIGKSEAALNQYIDSSTASSAKPLNFQGSFILCANNIVHPSKNEKALIRIQHDGGTLKLVLFNQNGRNVRTLENSSRAAGIYAFTWDGKGDAGQDLGSGVYFLRAESGSQVKMEKLVVIR